MILYVRQEAYYNAVPDGAKITRAEQIERSNLGIVEVVEKSGDDSGEVSTDVPDISIQERQEIPMPELTPGSEYLVAFLHSAGTAMATGMGLSGLSWQEIEAWKRCTDHENVVTPRDLKTVHMLSRVYAGEYSKASQKGATPPYVPKLEIVEETREIISEKADELFAGLIANQTKG